MAETTIEWTATQLPDGTSVPGFTFNPWLGCTKVSPACDHCYAEGWAKRAGSPALWQGERRRTTEAYWRQPLKWNQDACAAGARRKVFCASLADVFDNQVPDAWRQDLWELISVTPHLDWLLLTKRPQNIGKMLPKPETMWCGDDPHYAWPWPNVWLGTTVENQEEADRRIPHLLSVPAPVHFLWCEPLLGPVDLSNTRSSLSEGGSWRDVLECGDSGRLPSIDWVIAGGESGPGARPSHPDWFRSLRDQCQAAGAAFFFKQWGEWWPEPGGYIEPLQHQVIPLHLWPDLSPYSYSVRLGKKRAGALLDGREWREVPNG